MLHLGVGTSGKVFFLLCLSHCARGEKIRHLKIHVLCSQVLAEIPDLEASQILSTIVDLTVFSKTGQCLAKSTLEAGIVK